MKRKKKFYTDEKLDETIEMVDGHLENIFDEIGKILGFNINTEMNELIKSYYKNKKSIKAI